MSKICLHLFHATWDICFAFWKENLISCKRLIEILNSLSCPNQLDGKETDLPLFSLRIP
jgi:hypothetical protein